MQKRFSVLTVVFLSLLMSLWSSDISANDAPVTIIQSVNVVDMRTGEVRPNMSVVVEGTRIVEVAADNLSNAKSSNTAVESSSGTRIINGRGKYIMPGLGEMHGHIPPLTPFQGMPERYMNDVLFLYLAGGVTTVRGMLGYPHQLNVAQQLNNGERDGPTLYLAGPSFSGNTVSNLRQARMRVAEQAQAGWALLKVHPGLSLNQYVTMANEAKAHGISFAGHVPEQVGIHHAIIQGSRTIDHLDGYMAATGGMTEPVPEGELRELARFTRAHGVGVVPTQALWATIIGAGAPAVLLAYDELKYVPKPVREGWIRYAQNPNSSYATVATAQIHAENRQRLLRILHEEGVEILLGTDAPQLFSVPGFSIRREIAFMQQAGMSNLAILQSGTIAVGRYFAAEDSFGLIEPGARADLLLLEQNPLEQIDTLYNPAAVMANGRWYSREVIQQRLADIAAAYN